MVKWRQLLAIVSAAAVVVGVFAFAPVVADQRKAAQGVSEGGGVEQWGEKRASFAADDGPWVATSSRSGSPTYDSNVLAIRADGTLEALPGTTAGVAAIPANVQGQQVLSVSTAQTEAMAVTADGAVHKWGGRGIPDGTISPDALGGQAVEASLGGASALVRLADGGVVLFDGSYRERVENYDTGEVLTGVTQVVAGRVSVSAAYYGVALRSDGSVVRIDGHDGWTPMIPADPSDPVVDIDGPAATNAASTVAATAGGTFYLGGTEITGFPTEQLDGNIVQIAVGGPTAAYIFALTDQGSVIGWNRGIPNPDWDVPSDVTNAKVLRLDGEGGRTVRAIITDRDDPGLPALEVTSDPSISGDPKVGATLTATPATFNETDGVTLSHQWYATEPGGEPQPIVGATEETLALMDDHVGRIITYTTTAHRSADGAELESPPSNEIGPVVERFRIVGTPGIIGQPYIGRTLTVQPAATNEARSPFTVQWYVGDGEDFEPVEGATSLTFQLNEEHEGEYVRWVQTSTSPRSGETATAESVVVGPVSEPLGEFTVEEQPTIDGTPQVGETITATPATFSDTEGVTLEHLWYADDTQIEDANGPTLTLDQSHEGAMISYATKGTRTIDGAEATSERTEAVGPVVPVDLLITGQPTITGQPFIGEELTVTPAEVSDDRAETTYQWYAGDGEEFTPIDGATGTTLELTEELRDQHVKVEQIATRGIDDARTSAESIAVGPVTDAPAELTVVTEAGLTGTPRVGQTLTGTPATFSTTEGVTITNYWVIGTQEIEATGTTLVLTDEHVRQSIQFKSVATRGDEVVPSVSPTVGPVLVVLEATAKPTISGTPQVGETLTGTPATFNDTQGVTVANRWLADGQPISGATSTTLRLTEDQFGKVITFESTATRGADTATSVSDPTSTVTRAPLAVTSKPTISGDARVGQTLTGTPAVYSSTEGVTITNRWLADGQPIDGATGTTLVLTGEHLGRVITFESIAQRGDENPVSSVSDPTGPVLPEQDQEPSGDVVIDLDGPTAPGATIRVSVGTDFAGQQVQLYLSSIDRLLGGVTVDKDGFIEVKVPGDIPLGAHTLAVYDANGDLIGWDDFSVTLERPEDPAFEDGITVTPDTMAPGQEVVITVGEQYAGQMVRVVLFSTPRDLGFFQVAADGTIRVQIPSDVAPGEHRVGVYDANGNLIGWQDITVTGDVAPGGGAGSGTTGRGMGNFGAESPQFLAPLGLAVLLAGAVTLGAGWRRRRQLS